MESKRNPLLTLVVLLAAGWLILGPEVGGCAIVNPLAPPPFKAEKLCVLVVEETVDRSNYTAGQREVITSVGGVREYVKAKAGEFWVIDKDTPLDKAAPWVQEARKAAQPNLLPWIVAANPKSGFTRQLPQDAAETLAAVKKLGGE